MTHAPSDDCDPASRKLSALGDPVTLCVACYGQHVHLARRFLSTLYGCTDPSRFTLRAGLNEAEPATHQLFEDYSRIHGNVDLFVEPRNIFKNPIMRRLFYERPLTSPWTVWCDDDTHFTEPDWLNRLSHAIEQHREIAMWGARYYILNGHPTVLDWIRAASWYRSVPFLEERLEDGTSAVRMEFATGGFWALRTDVLRQLDWPDPRLVHAGEDVLLGEALRQNGFQIGEFDGGVRINDAPRRNADAPEIRELPR